MPDFLGILSKLIVVKNAKCVYCRRDVPGPEEVCPACLKKQEQLLNKTGFYGNYLYVFEYSGIVRKLIHNFKYNDMPFLGVYMAARMAAYLNAADVKFDLITYVPIHENRLKWRGFDQSEMLAGYLGAEMGIPCKRLLRRTRDTVPQFDLSRKERQKNMKGAFCAEGKLSLKGKKVLLIDDVCTTGSTIDACSAILEKSGAVVLPFTYSFEK
jgi:competence protein ComFC